MPEWLEPPQNYFYNLLALSLFLSLFLSLSLSLSGVNTVNGDCKSDFVTACQKFPLITKNLINQRKWDVLLKPIGWPLDCLLEFC